MAKGTDWNTLVVMWGGQFRLASIVQKRMKELVKGARPLVDVPRGRKDLMDIVFQELAEGRIEPTEDVPDEPPAGEMLFKPVIEDED